MSQNNQIKTSVVQLEAKRAKCFGEKCPSIKANRRHLADSDNT